MISNVYSVIFTLPNNRCQKQNLVRSQAQHYHFLLDSKQAVCYKKYMAEGAPIPPPEGEAPQGASFTPAEQPEQRSADETQLLDADALASDLENAGLHTLAENMRQPTASSEEIRQHHHQELEERIRSENAKLYAEAATRPPSVSQPEEKTQRLDLHDVADFAEQQKKHTLAAELRKLANKPPTT